MKTGWEKLITAARTVESERAGAPSWLQTCIEYNAATEYGRAYGFKNICDVDDYRTRVPLTVYEDLKPFIEKILAGTADVLFAGSPIAFEKTGGSGGGEKIIPYSRESLRDFRNALLPWIASLAGIYGLGSGRAYLAVSPALRTAQNSPSGVPLGLPDSAYLGKDATAAISELSVVSQDTAALTCFDEWQLATLYELLRAPDLEMISVWSPTFMSSLMEGVHLRKPELLKIFREGGTIGGRGAPSDNPARRRLESYGGGDASVLWPDLKLVSCWTDGSSAPYVAALSKRFPHAAMQGKGLLLTEGVVTVPDIFGRPLLALGSGFYEFLDEDGNSRLCHELKEGETYEVIMTTSGGLYRYRAGDSVRCTGYAESTPVLRFAGRCGVFSDLTGEKLSDAFVLDCLIRAECEGMLIPRSLPEPGYLLLTEEKCGDDKLMRLEAALRRNPQYAYAREMRQLRPLSFRRIENLAKRYADCAFSQGRRLGDVKIPALCTDSEWMKEAQG
ncbi:hypothetical protein FACS1894187_09760 [Synergistales bacterium]|nr:hypothetical protein FACS1894187_09760 [Synergistales bacterium]